MPWLEYERRQDNCQITYTRKPTFTQAKEKSAENKQHILPEFEIIHRGSLAFVRALARVHVQCDGNAHAPTMALISMGGNAVKRWCHKTISNRHSHRFLICRSVA